MVWRRGVWRPIGRICGEAAVLLYTDVDHSHSGESYRTADWQYIGETSGRFSDDSQSKSVFAYPLAAEWREQLCTVQCRGVVFLHTRILIWLMMHIGQKWSMAHRRIRTVGCNRGFCRWVLTGSASWARRCGETPLL